MYRDNDVAQYYDEMLLMNYGKQYWLFTGAIVCLAITGIVVPPHHSHLVIGTRGGMKADPQHLMIPPRRASGWFPVRGHGAGEFADTRPARNSNLVRLPLPLMGSGLRV